MKLIFVGGWFEEDEIGAKLYSETEHRKFRPRVWLFAKEKPFRTTTTNR